MILAGCKKEENLAIGIVQTVDHPTLTTIWQGIVDEIKNYNLQNEKPIEIVNLTISKDNYWQRHYIRIQGLRY